MQELNIVQAGTSNPAKLKCAMQIMLQIKTSTRHHTLISVSLACQSSVTDVTPSNAQQLRHHCTRLLEHLVSGRLSVGLLQIISLERTPLPQQPPLLCIQPGEKLLECTCGYSSGWCTSHPLCFRSSAAHQEVPTSATL